MKMTTSALLLAIGAPRPFADAAGDATWATWAFSAQFGVNLDDSVVYPNVYGGVSRLIANAVGAAVTTTTPIVGEATCNKAR